MKKSVFCKALAMILSVLLLCSTLLFAATTVFAGMAGGYTGGYGMRTEEIRQYALQTYAWDVWQHCADKQPLTDRFAENNFYYTVTVNGVRQSESNFSGQPHVRTVSVSQRAGDLIRVELYEKATHTYTDLLSTVAWLLDTVYTMRFVAPTVAVLSLLFWVLTVIFLFSAAGHRKGTDTPMLNRVDRIPFDLHSAITGTMLFGIGVCACLLLETCMYNYYYRVSETLFVLGACSIGILACGIAAYLLLLGYLLSLATRLKVGGLLRRTVCGRILRFLWRTAQAVGRSVWKLLRAIPLVWKTALLLVGISLLECIIITVNLHEGDNILLFWFLEKLLLCPVILYAAILLRKLKKGGEAIAAGDLDRRIDTKYMPADFGDFGKTLNHIGDGLGHAVEERLKSERMKTELITNVSHDIKTPLTSIVNYVDLLKKEEHASETVRGYIDVLDRQSARLKKLTDDLVEASKAATGAITIEKERCEIGVLLEQSLGEYAERMAECRLTPVVTVPEEPITILADGRRLWRVFDNLLSNICKYALAETRVYITLARHDGRAVLTFRNISRDALSVSAEDLAERFVRGDASRNTEGSGLGLSIARSLTELMGGTLSLTVDGDLFKAEVEFPVVQ